VVWYEREDGRLVIEEIDQDALLMLWLTERYKIDLRLLLFLYDKYGKDMWFFFYLFADMRIKFPSLRRLLTVIKEIQRVLRNEPPLSPAGILARNVLENGVIELDLRDKKRFPFGSLGVIVGSEGSEESDL